MNKKLGKRKQEDIGECLSTDQKPKCVFCKSEKKNKYWLGKMMSREHTFRGIPNPMYAHYYCILFSPGLQQNGKLDEGFKGFLIEDIKKEVNRGSFLFCSYCREKGAVIGCNVTECKIKFHLTCGLVNDSFHDFHNTEKSFPSYCSQHRPFQRTSRVNSTEDVCVICREEVDKTLIPKSLLSPCCSSWLHRECVVKQAYHSGKHHFKCPKCNDSELFVEEMKAYGVYVPSRDASWEKGEEFNQMFRKDYNCSADKCLSKKGTDYNGENEWELLACDGCGSHAIHIRCAKLDVNSDEWLCSLCKTVLDKKKEQTQQQQQEGNSGPNKKLKVVH